MCIKPIERDRAIYVNAIAVPIICSLVSNKKTKIAINKHPFLKKLKLADKVSSGCSEEIEMLIGADIYWKLVSDKIKKDNNSGLVAIKSSFGWLINGPLDFNRNTKVDVNLIKSCVLQVQCEVTAENN